LSPHNLYQIQKILKINIPLLKKGQSRLALNTQILSQKKKIIALINQEVKLIFLILIIAMLLVEVEVVLKKKMIELIQELVILYYIN
jgi:hypothetical protein